MADRPPKSQWRKGGLFAICLLVLAIGLFEAAGPISVTAIYLPLVCHLVNICLPFVCHSIAIRLPFACYMNAINLERTPHLSSNAL